MKSELIRKRVKAGDYLIKAHAVQHAIKEGFVYIFYPSFFKNILVDPNDHIELRISRIILQLQQKTQKIPVILD